MTILEVQFLPCVWHNHDNGRLSKENRQVPAVLFCFFQIPKNENQLRNVQIVHSTRNCNFFYQTRCTKTEPKLSQNCKITQMQKVKIEIHHPR